MRVRVTSQVLTLSILLTGIVSITTTVSGFNAASLQVPFIKQTREGCGSASMAMIIEYWRDRLPTASIQPADVRQIQQRLHTPEARGIYGADMEAFLREAGFHAFRIKGTKDDLLEHLSRGRPLIVCLQPSRGAPLHYVVVTGYEKEADAFIVNDPARGKFLQEDASRFLKAWKPTGNWTMIAVPKGSN
jgi:ABC-type bacteriocin/lantibiotic exporter with double-glycine peptidase domain